MIYGIGTDMIEISRIEKSLKRKGFLTHVFSTPEIDAFSKRNDTAVKLAGCFAAKEAFSKALGTGLRGFELNEVSVLRDDLGKPYFEFTGAAEKIMTEHGLAAFVTISNTDTLALSSVVLESSAETKR